MVSCGGTGTTNVGDKVGALWAVSGSESFSAQELSQVKLICQAFKKKSSVIELVMIPNSKKMNFEVSNRSCHNPDSAEEEETEEVKPSTISSLISKTTEGLYFSTSTGLYSSQVIDHNHSLVAQICTEALNNVDDISKVVMSGDIAVVFKTTTKLNNSKCLTTDGNCLSIIYGKKIETNYFETVSQIILAVNTDTSDSQFGFIENIIYESAGSCEKEDYFTKLEQTLKSID